MVVNGSDRLMVVCAICRMCTQLAMIHFSKEKLFYFPEQTFAQQTQHTKLGSFLIGQNFCRDWVGRLVNDPLRPQTNIYANTSNAAISDPLHYRPCSNRFWEFSSKKKRERKNMKFVVIVVKTISFYFNVARKATQNSRLD